MVKVAFLINSMGGGGAERVVSILLKNLSRDKKEFFLIVLEDKFNYQIPENVRLIKFSPNLDNNFKKFLAIFSGAVKLKKLIKENQIDLVVSFLERSNFINILAKKLGSSHKAYISERCNTSEYYSARGLKSFFNLFLIKRLYKKADLVIVNSLAIKKNLIDNFSIKPKKAKVIYNPIDIKRVKVLAEMDLKEKYQNIFQQPVVISIGRLIPEKGHNYLIKAFKQVAEQIKGAKLLILGQGELKQDLKTLTKKLNLENDVLFLGWQENAFKYLARAEVFVLSSLTEGFPNVLTEAMACRVPVISTNCPSGPNEIIEDKKSGILVPVADERALAEAMLKILNNPSLGEKLSQKGEKRVKDFSVKNIIDKYEQLF